MINDKYFSFYIGSWWVLWIVSSVLGRIYFRKVTNAETIQELLESNKLSMINTAISIPLALITIKVIYDYSNLEKELYYFKNEEIKEENELITVSDNNQ